VSTLLTGRIAETHRSTSPDEFAADPPSPWQRPLQEVSGLARPGTPPDPDPDPDPDRPAARAPTAVRLPQTVDRVAVPRVVEACLARVPANAPGVTCDARFVRTPRLSELDAVARLALSARRNRREFRLEHAGPALLDLIGLCGLSDELDPGRGPPAG
jgi:hypothetical protein